MRCPVATQPGPVPCDVRAAPPPSRPQGRVAAHAVALSGVASPLVTHSLKDFADTAVALASHPRVLAALRARLVRSREQGRNPVFHHTACARALERAYALMWDVRLARLAPPAGVRAHGPGTGVGPTGGAGGPGVSACGCSCGGEGAPHSTRTPGAAECEWAGMHVAVTPALGRCVAQTVSRD
jgi:hypothetical protein